MRRPLAFSVLLAAELPAQFVCAVLETDCQ
jgi:hypothetical protein